ncbi:MULTISPECIES: AAA family ATPase [unclassified Streptomyces]|uniref:ATP-binding protein n=1 Tax=unclassified Streptomyces TaxID=2593676 RepID=UPI00278BE819|nr:MULTISPECIES: AAA family ATPase [unclassified Streptomyces]
MDALGTDNGPNSGAPRLRLHLFDGFRATRDGGPEPAARWSRPSARTLVKLLAVVPGHRLHREQAMDICWPEADPASAAGSLRVALHAARHALEPELAPRATSSYLRSSGGMLSLDPTTVRIDADEAETAARTALADGDSAELAAALALFTGELLPEDRYASWSQERRGQLALLRERLLLGLAQAHLAEGAAAEAATVAEQLVATSPAEELAHRVLIDASLRQGLRRRALHQYHACREALETELGVRPGPQTEALHRAALAAAPAPVSASTTLPSLLRAGPATPLHGRDAVLDRLLAAEGPPVTLLTGEAGVGKTRLVGEVARRAAARGTAALWGGGQDAEGHTPYGAFAEALDGWLAEHDADQRARIAAEYPELAAFLPSLGQIRIRAAGERSPEEERDRLFRAGAALLADLASAHPVLTVLDDLHAADTGSYQLMSHLARRAASGGTRLRFLVTYREEELPEDDPRRSILSFLLRQHLAVREELPRLDREACLAVLRGIEPRRRTRAGGVRGSAPILPPSQRSSGEAQRIWELSLGNPLFALELARDLAANPVTEPGAAAPAGIRDLVADRLIRLDPDTRRLVEALSVAGGEAALTELLDVAAHALRPPVTGAAAADGVERAITAALVEERQVVVAGRPEPGLAFRHPLVRLTCYERLTAVRRRQLHGAFAQAVLARRPDAVDALASHFARADDPRAAEYLRRAAERAAALYANDTADRYYRDLVARLDVDAARARLAHSQVLSRMGHFEEASGALREALAEFVRRGAHEDAVLTAARLAESLVRTGALDAAAEALHAHPPTPDTAPEPVAAHHLSRAVLDGVRGHYDDGHAAARSALEAARRVPGPHGQGLLARSYALQATNLGLSGRLTEAREAGDLALAPAEAYGDPTLLGTVLSTLRENARRHGRLREAVASGERALDLADRSGNPTAASFERLNLAELHLLLDEFDEATSLAEVSVTLAEGDGAWCLPYALATLARVRLRTGDIPAATRLLDRATPAADHLGDRQARFEVSTARAELSLRTGHPEAALLALTPYQQDAPVLTAWSQLLSGNPRLALRTATTEAARAARTGERLTETEAHLARAAALSHLSSPEESTEALTHATTLATSLPYPSALHRAHLPGPCHSCPSGD